MISWMLGALCPPEVRPVGARQWSMHDPRSAKDLQTIIDLYRSGVTAKTGRRDVQFRRVQRETTARRPRHTQTSSDHTGVTGAVSCVRHA